MNLLLIIAVVAVVVALNHYVGAWAGFVAVILIIGGFCVLKWADILMIRGNGIYNKGDRKKGLELMEKAYNTGKLKGTMVVYYSYCLIRENMNEKAHEVMDKYIAEGKGTPADLCRAMHNKAILLWKDGRLDEAFDTMKKAHESRPASDTYGTLGLFYLEKAKAEPQLSQEAENFLKEAYEYNSDDRSIADNMGTFYLEKGELDRAAEVYKALLAQPQPSPTPYYRYGLVLEKQGNYEDAEDMFNKALRCSFTGVTVIKRDEVTEALARVEKLYEIAEKPANAGKNEEE